MSGKVKNPHAVKLGKKGGPKGGAVKVPKGLAKMSPEKRKEIASAGGYARWDVDTLE